MKTLINPNILELTPYKPGNPVEEIKRKFNLNKVIKLASNENPSKVPAHVSEAIRREITNINAYPENFSYYLRQKIAEYNGINTENVIVGAGSVDIIRMIVNAFLKPGQTVMTSEKTFISYKISTIEYGGKQAFLEAPMDADYRYNLDNMYHMMDEKTKIFFIANPNNPTGTMLPKQKIKDFIEKVPKDKIIVIDNAYQEYVNKIEDYFHDIETTLNSRNIILLRTFSKIYALAGLRVGYAISNEAIISYLGRVKTTFNVSRLSQVAALASLQDDKFKNKSAALNLKNREKLYQQLKRMGLKVIQPEANFILFFPDTDIAELNNRLLKEGIIIRPLQAFGIPNGMRVTVGLEEDNDFFIEKLKKILDEIK